MPVNPNIALGVQQQQPVNMLGQMGQMMALKAASQEMQSNEEMRNLFAGGANFDDPDFQKRGYMANPKAFQELLGKRATTNKTQMESLGKEVALRRDAITNINTPEDYLKWHDANHQGSLGAFFKSAGISPSRESIIAQLNQPGGLDKLKRNSALGATELQKQLMQTERSVQVANIGAAAPLGQLALAQKKFNLEETQQAELSRILRGETPTGAPAVTGAPMGGVGGAPAVAGGPAVSGAVAPVAAPATAPNVNALNAGATPAAAANVNLLTEGAVPPQIAQMQSQIGQLIRVGTPKAIIL